MPDQPPPSTCGNCGGTDGVQRLSFDLDLPAVDLCRICGVAIALDPALFVDLGRNRG